MIANSVSFRGHRCFKNDWSGFDSIKPINVIIGRNNTGKSHLLDLASAMCAGKFKGRGWTYRFRGILDEESLRRVFQEGRSGGNLSGDHWETYGQRFVGVPLTWEVDQNGEPTKLHLDPDFDFAKFRYSVSKQVPNGTYPRSC